MTTISPIRWHDGTLALLDQRFLPEKQQDYLCETLEHAAQAIADLVVRGAPAIGITAAYAVCLGYRQSMADSTYDLNAGLDKLANARPTAVNLAWAVAQQREIIQSGKGDIADQLLQNARRIHQQDIDNNQVMGSLGAELISADSNVLTHCNAGALATGGYGTALGVIRSARAAGKLKRVYASETRPWLQGLRLTAWELAHSDIPVSVIVEGAASALLGQKGVDWIIVGSDRICANGDVINKIGTCNLAVLARYYGVKFMVVAPTSTIDMTLQSGDEVEIESRAESEILAERYADEQRVHAWNPVFDVTPAGLVDAIVTESGVVLQPDREKMTALMAACSA